MEWLKFLIKNVLYVMKEIVSTLFDNVVISVFVNFFYQNRGDIDFLKCIICRT